MQRTLLKIFTNIISKISLNHHTLLPHQLCTYGVFYYCLILIYRIQQSNYHHSIARRRCCCLFSIHNALIFKCDDWWILMRHRRRLCTRTHFSYRIKNICNLTEMQFPLLYLRVYMYVCMYQTKVMYIFRALGVYTLS